MTRIATVSMNVSYDKNENLQKYFKFMEEAANHQADLVVFPEQSLQGYLPSMSQLDLSHYQYQYENAEIISEGNAITQIIEKAKLLNLYVVFGFTEKDADYDYKLYNASVLTGPDGFIGSYRKIHQPIDEVHIYYTGDTYPVYETKIGRIGLMICLDKAFPEAARELALAGADIIVTPLAWPYAFPENFPNSEKDPNYQDHMIYDRARAMENQIFYVSSNHYGQSGRSTYIGYSNIIGPNGQILATTGNEEKIVYADVNVKQDIYTGKTVGMGGVNLLRERKPETYRHIGISETL